MVRIKGGSIDIRVATRRWKNNVQKDEHSESKILN